MPEKHLFEYASVHVVPKIERREFINIGVVMYCAATKFLDSRFQLNESRLASFSPSIDIGSLKEYAAAYEQICKGGDAAGAIGKLPVAERFRWLTATRSTVIQCSPVHNGMCDDASQQLGQLFSQLVLQD